MKDDLDPAHWSTASISWRRRRIVVAPAHNISSLGHVLIMRVLVTGGAGFIGSHLCDRLVQRGDQVWCVDNFHLGRQRNIAHLDGSPQFTFVQMDVLERAGSGRNFCRCQVRRGLPYGRQFRHRRRQRRRRARPQAEPAHHHGRARSDARPRRRAAVLCQHIGDFRRDRRGAERGLRPAAADLVLRREQARRRSLYFGLRAYASGSARWCCAFPTSSASARPTA